jgi:hypothetical protein
MAETSKPLLPNLRFRMLPPEMNHGKSRYLENMSFTQDGNFADPDGVNLRFRPPRQTDTTWIYGIDAAIVKDSTGVYHADLDTIPTAGIWRYRWEGGGAVAFRQFIVARTSG